MKRMLFCFLLLTALSELVYAGLETFSQGFTVALPQPTTVLICAVGVSFFRFVGKYVP